MELCTGMPLYHHIKKLPEQRMEPELCKTIFRQVALGIGYMHSRNKAHRDLKLDNLLFDAETQKIKIIDFGFSLTAQKTENASSVCGTPHYMCPDLARKAPYNPFAADVWAAGVILYTIYVGKLPFYGEFEGDLFRRIQTGKF